MNLDKKKLKYVESFKQTGKELNKSRHAYFQQLYS